MFYFLFLNCRFSNKYAFHMHAIAQVPFGKGDRHFAIYSDPSLEIELSLLSVRRTIPLLSSLEYVSDIVFSDVRISKTVSNTSAQHALGQRSSSPGPRNYKVYTGGDTTCFLGMRSIESSHWKHCCVHRVRVLETEGSCSRSSMFFSTLETVFSC